MELDKLYSIADKENISVFETRMTNKAIICKVDNNYHIGMDYSKIDNSVQEKEIFAEELGHYYCNALYNVYADAITISKKEYRAKKWAFKTLIPPSTLLCLKEQGYNSSCEIADELGVSKELAETAYNYYKENKYI